MPTIPPKKYKLKATEYAKIYNVSPDTIRESWMKRFAPLDKPDSMGLWLAVNLKHSSGAPIKLPPPKETEDDTEDEAAYTADESAIGARAEILALERECRAMGRLYTKNKLDPINGATYLKAWTGLLSALRQMGKDTPKTEKDDGKSVSVETVEASLTKNLLEMRKMLEAIPQTVALNLTHIEPEISIEVEELLKEEIAHVITSMGGAKWIE